MSSEPGSAVEQLRRELTATQQQVRGLRLALLRVACLVAVGLIVTGLVLPAWYDDDEAVRVATAGFRVLGDEESWGSATGGDLAFGVAFAVGLLGLLVVCVVAVGALAYVLYDGAGLRGRRFFLLVGTLAIIGSVVACLFSSAAFSSDESGTEAGWGAVVLLAGAIVYLAAIGSRAAGEMCFGQDATGG